MQLRQIVHEKFKSTLVKLLNQDTPLKTTILLKGIVDMLNVEIDAYDAERKKLLNEFAVKDFNGELLLNPDRTAVFDDAGYKSYAEAYNKLCDIEVDVPKITVAELGDKISLSYEDLIALTGLIVY